MKQSYLISMVFIIIFSLNISAQNIPITSNSKEAIANYLKAQEFENVLELDQAEVLYNNAIILDSTFAIAHLRLGMLRNNYDYRNTKLNDALKYINIISEGEKLLLMARVDVYSNKYDGTKEFDYTKQLVEMYPEDEEANYLFGLVNLHHGRSNPNISIQYFEKALALKSNYISAQYELANAYMTINDYEKAKEITKNTIELLPDAVEPLNTYAETFIRGGYYEESIVQYKNILEMNNTFPWALMGIAANLNFLNKHAEGREYLNRLIDTTLSDYEYRHKWRSKVVSFLDEGDFTNAINTLELQKQESLTGRNKREPIFHIYYSYLRKTKLYFESQDFENGFKEYNEWHKYVQENIKSETTKTRIKNLKTYYDAYEAYIKGNNNFALKILSESIIQNETDGSKILIGKLYFKEKKYQLAIDNILQTDLLNPHNQYWLMMAYLKNGNNIEAKKWRDKIIQLNERNNIDLALVRKKTLLVNLCY